MDDKTKIHYSSPEAATYRTDIKGWVSAKGHYYGAHPGSEHMARYDGATHWNCAECGAETEIWYTRCDTCRAAKRAERFAALEAVEWDERTPLCIFEGDTFFFSIDEVMCHCEEEGIELADIRLVICDPVYGREFGVDDFYDELPEDGKLPDAILEAVENLNRVVRAYGPLSWTPGRKRALVAAGAVDS